MVLASASVLRSTVEMPKSPSLTISLGEAPDEDDDGLCERKTF